MTHSFTDTNGARWTVEINVSTVRRCRSVVGVDLMQAATSGGEALSALVTDPVGLVDVLYLCCEREAKDRGVSDEDFGRGLAGDAIERATAAFVQALIDFFPNARDRKMLTESWQRMNRLMERGRDAIERKMDDPEMEEAAMEEFDRVLERMISGEPSTSSQESPA